MTYTISPKYFHFHIICKDMTELHDVFTIPHIYLKHENRILIDSLFFGTEEKTRDLLVLCLNSIKFGELLMKINAFTGKFQFCNIKFEQLSYIFHQITNIDFNIEQLISKLDSFSLQILKLILNQHAYVTTLISLEGQFFQIYSTKLHILRQLQELSNLDLVHCSNKDKNCQHNLNQNFDIDKHCQCKDLNKHVITCKVCKFSINPSFAFVINNSLIKRNITLQTLYDIPK